MVMEKINKNLIPMQVNPNAENNLIKYKIDTNLEEFNKNRPGISCDSDCNDDINELKTTKGSNDLSEFRDARFYTEHHFLKLANQLKEKTISKSIVSSKPINIVEPFNENITTSTSNEQLSPISYSLWKLQREQYEEHIRYLEEQIKGFYEQLEIQTQINAELKKLLVASIGDDIQYKVERLVNDKQRFEHELTKNSKRLAKISEELEQISIQCDLWRTKFIASKSLNDELNTWKTFLLMLQQEYNHLIRNILTENENNNKKLNNIYNKLHVLNETSKSNTDFSVKNNLKVVNLIEKVINEMFTNKSCLNQEVNIIDSLCDNNIIKSMTKNEYMAKQLCTQFSWLPYSNENSIELIESLLNGLKVQKTKLIQRYDQFNDDTLNLTCCSKCKGNIKIV